MIYGRALLRPAAAEVRQMLHRIKMDNMAAAQTRTTTAEEVGGSWKFMAGPKLKPYEQ